MWVWLGGLVKTSTITCSTTRNWSQPTGDAQPRWVVMECSFDIRRIPIIPGGCVHPVQTNCSWVHRERYPRTVTRDQTRTQYHFHLLGVHGVCIWFLGVRLCERPRRGGKVVPSGHGHDGCLPCLRGDVHPWGVLCHWRSTTHRGMYVSMWHVWTCMWSYDRMLCCDMLGCDSWCVGLSCLACCVGCVLCCFWLSWVIVYILFCHSLVYHHSLVWLCPDARAKHPIASHVCPLDSVWVHICISLCILDEITDWALQL